MTFSNNTINFLLSLDWKWFSRFVADGRGKRFSRFVADGRGKRFSRFAADGRGKRFSRFAGTGKSEPGLLKFCFWKRFPGFICE